MWLGNLSSTHKIPKGFKLVMCVCVTANRKLLVLLVLHTVHRCKFFLYFKEEIAWALSGWFQWQSFALLVWNILQKRFQILSKGFQRTPGRLHVSQKCRSPEEAESWNYSKHCWCLESFCPVSLRSATLILASWSLLWHQPFWLSYSNLIGWSVLVTEVYKS